MCDHTIQICVPTPIVPLLREYTWDLMWFLYSPCTLPEKERRHNGYRNLSIDIYIIAIALCLSFAWIKQCSSAMWLLWDYLANCHLWAIYLALSTLIFLCYKVESFVHNQSQNMHTDDPIFNSGFPDFQISQILRCQLTKFQMLV